MSITAIFQKHNYFRNTLNEKDLTNITTELKHQKKHSRYEANENPEERHLRASMYCTP